MALIRFVVKFIIRFVMGECKSIQTMKKFKLKGLPSDLEVSVIENIDGILDFINECPPKERDEWLSFIEKAKLDSSYSLSIDKIRRENGRLHISALCFNMFADVSADLILLKAKAEDSKGGLINMLTFRTRLHDQASGKEVQSGL
ncbi:hypothetical protein OAI07_02210 [Akkermansiaceae bacterium]|nr:hypothetical protein [Akkermansiaceae bacterium]